MTAKQKKPAAGTASHVSDDTKKLQIKYNISMTEMEEVKLCRQYY